MPKTHPNQQSFSQGELSPLMYGRTDLELYGAGVKKLLNMYADSRGPARAREGMKLITQFSDTNARVEVIPRTSNTFFTLIFLHEELKIIRNIFNPVIETFVTVWTRDQIDDIQIVTLPDADTIYLLHPNVQTYKLEDQTEAAQSQTFTTSGTFVVPAGIVEMSLCVCGAGGGGGGGNTIEDNPGGGGAGGGGSGVVKDVVLTVPAENLTITIGSGGAGGSPGNNGNAGGNSSVSGGFGSLTSNGGAGGIHGQTGAGGSGGSGGGSGGAGGGTSSNGINGGTCTAVCSEGSFVGGSRGDTFVTIGGAGGGGGGGFGIGGKGGTFSPNSPDGKYGSRTGGGGGGRGYLMPDSFNGGPGGTGKVSLFWELSSTFVLSAVTFTAPPINWTGTNWPSSGTFYQGRLWLGGTPENPEHFLGSKSNDPENLTVGNAADDAISVAIESFGSIEWMESTKVLLIGTANGEYIVTAESGLLKPGDIEVEQQSAYGSASIQPVKIGDQILYVSPDLKKVRSINYEWQQNNWFSKDLTFASEHITAGKIKNLTWSANPNNLLWGVLHDGTLCCMTYERSNNIVGWHRHNTQGTLLGGAAGFDGEKDIFVCAVERSPGIINIEYLTFDYYLDAWQQTFTIVTSGELFYVEGFDYLDGFEVQILIDGAVHPSRIVGGESRAGISDGIPGRIYIDYTGSNVVVGLGFDSEIELLDYDSGSETGSGLSLKKRRNNIYVKLLESGVPLINGERGLDRTPSTPMGTPEPYISGTIEFLGLGWDRQANVNIKQDLPLPLTVLSIYGELARNKL